jgi:hypothetical protein
MEVPGTATSRRLNAVAEAAEDNWLTRQRPCAFV